MAETSTVRATGLVKRFGAVTALASADLVIAPGEVLGLIGHNGAGKSTLVNILAGVFSADEGTLEIAGVAHGHGWTPKAAHAAGIRVVFQELALCPNLSSAENTRIVHPGIRGFGWKRTARALILAALDRIFPGHGIDVDRPVGELALGQRQMVEIARAFTSTDAPPRLVILDEPTSSLDSRTARQLLDGMRAAAGEGIAVVLISHMLGEILASCDRVVVMKDGRVVADRTAQGLTRATLVELMGHVGEAQEDRRAARAAATGAVVIADRQNGFACRAGEIIGLAGLAGHGQTSFLRRLFDSAAIERTGKVAFVAGDRQSDGVFPLWSIGQNIGVRSLNALKRAGLIDPAAEERLAQEWRERIAVRTDDVDKGILTLSGGNQQKCLFARALASDASIILMDDPMRGVDVGTKNEVYRLIRTEAEAGRSFVWYTTEFDELDHCDRVHVFRDGGIVATLDHAEVSEQAVLAASFADKAA